VVDLEMPVIDGVQFLQLLQRKYPSTPRTVLTGRATEASRAACLSSGAEFCLEKPTSSDEIRHLYATLNELTQPVAEEGFRGVLRRVGLPDVLQMECLAANSSVLEVTADDARGEIYIRSGAIIHAWTGSLKGEEAFYHLLCLRGGQFALRPFVQPDEQTIDGSWEFLIMESARRQDEARGEPVGEEPPPVPQQVMEVPSMTSYLPSQEEPDGPPPPAARLEEVLLCSSQGEVLYEWQCSQTEARISLLEFVSQKAWQMEHTLPVGRFDRIEIQGPQSRVVSQIQADRGLFVRSTPPPPAA
jgi:hypothetical protein